MNYSLYKLSDRKDLLEELIELNDCSWPEFLKHGNTAHWNTLYQELAPFQLLFCEQETGKLIGAGFTVPINWSCNVEDLPTTIEDIILNGLNTIGINDANTLTAIGALVSSEVRAQHLSSKILAEMKKLTISNNLSNLIVPVRPTWKAKYPLQAINDYVKWTREDGLCYDPWIRVHQRLGARIIKVTNCTLTVEGTINEWESWTDMIFPNSGNYIIPGGLTPVKIDTKNNLGIYKDPNVWMQHTI